MHTQYLDSLNDAQLLPLLQSSLVGVLPTDTVYGLAALASSATAVSRLYELKNRSNKPGTLVAAGIDQIVDMGVPRRYLKAVEQFWPGPISVVIPMGSQLEYLHQGLGTLAVRIPAPGAFHSLLEQSGPLLTSSANQPGEPPASTVAEAKQYFGDTVSFYVDGGDLAGQQSSTIVRIVDDAIEILREGAAIINERGELQ